MTGNRRASRTDLFESSQVSDSRIFTVSELTSNVRAVLEQQFGMVKVVGEISGMSVAASGHGYFSLKDEHASIPAVMFRSALARLGDGLPEDGTEVECLGRLTLYEPRGRTQLVVEWMVPKKIGALGLKFLALKAKLESEGLFDPERKRPIPFLPRQIGIVTSPTGAAIQDILKVLDRRFPSIAVLLYPVRVQGQGASGEIARAVAYLGAESRADVIIVGRGGGSVEDLWSFNEEEVVRSIAACQTPVISAVGHEVDIVLSDLAADVRAPTPTAAAEMVVPDRSELIQRLSERAQILKRALDLKIAGSRNRLSGSIRQIRDPRLVLAAHRMRLDDAARNMQKVVSGSLSVARRRMAEARVGLAAKDLRPTLRLARTELANASARLVQTTFSGLNQRQKHLQSRRNILEGLSPFAVLGRGYSVVSLPDGAIVSDSAQVARGDPVHVRLQRGSFDGSVTGVAKEKDKIG